MLSFPLMWVVTRILAGLQVVAQIKIVNGPHTPDYYILLELAQFLKDKIISSDICIFVYILAHVCNL